MIMGSLNVAQKERKYNNIKSQYMIDELPHIPQLDEWDCGVACLKMSLKYINPKLSDESLSSAQKKHNLGTSVWTIDLAYLCSILEVRHKLYTQTLGVDKKYAEESFYTQSIGCGFNEEESRVNDLFSKANTENVNVEKRSVDVTEIICHIENKQPVIVLIDDRKLRKNYIKNEDQESNPSCWSCICCGFGGNSKKKPESHSLNDLPISNFWGHYVVVVGYDIKQKIFTLQDPNDEGKHVRCTFEALDEARKSFGTDEDILFLYKSR